MCLGAFDFGFRTKHRAVGEFHSDGRRSQHAGIAVRDGIQDLLAHFNRNGDVFVGRLQGVVLLGEGAHGKHEERREKEFFHDGEVLCRQK